MTVPPVPEPSKGNILVYVKILTIESELVLPFPVVPRETLKVKQRPGKTNLVSVEDLTGSNVASMLKF